MLKQKIYKSEVLNNKEMLFKLHQGERGFSTLLIVLIILALGMVIIKTYSYISSSWQKDYIQYQQYYYHFNQAQSSIDWATLQNWSPPTELWQCQTLASYQLSACIKLANLVAENYVIIKGESSQFKLYHLATYNNAKLKLTLGHWLDYCPNNRSQYCES